MPLYDCLLLGKSQVPKESLMELAARVGRRVYQRNGVITDIKSFGSVQLGYGMKKLDGRHYQGQLLQMTFMVPPTFHQELQYLNKEDRLLRWLVVKHRKAIYGFESINEDEGMNELSLFKGSSFYAGGGSNNEDDESDDEDYEEE